MSLVLVIVFAPMVFISMIGETDAINIDLVHLSENENFNVERMLVVVSLGKSI